MSERVNQLFRIFQDFFERSRAQRNILPYLLAKHIEEFYRFSPRNTDEGYEVFSDLVRQHAIELNMRAAEFGVYDFDDESPENCLLTKSFGEGELTFFEDLRNIERFDLNKFLKKGYFLEFFCLGIPLNQTQSIHLFQYVPGGYRAHPAPPGFFMSFFEDRYILHISDYSTGFNLRKDFNFCSFYDESDSSQCFSIINARTRKWYEKLFGYNQPYRDSYDEVSSIGIIDFSLIGSGTEDMWRKCHALLRSPYIDRCLEKLEEELLSDEYNTSKEYLDGKGIKYSTESGILQIIPIDLYQAKIIIKILEDKLVTTQYTERDGLADRIDEI